MDQLEQDLAPWWAIVMVALKAMMEGTFDEADEDLQKAVIILTAVSLSEDGKSLDEIRRRFEDDLYETELSFDPATSIASIDVRWGPGDHTVTSVDIRSYIESTEESNPDG